MRKMMKVGKGRDLRTYFDGKELRDATAPLSIPVLPTDLTAAEAVRSEGVNDQERFSDCLIAQTCIRMFGEDAKTAIMRETAWVSLPGEKYALRFVLPAESRKVVAGFDTKKPVGIGTFITLEPAPPGRSLVHMRKAKQAWSKRNREFQSGSGPRKTTNRQSLPDPLHGVIRNGAYVRL